MFTPGLTEFVLCLLRTYHLYHTFDDKYKQVRMYYRSGTAVTPLHMRRADAACAVVHSPGGSTYLREMT